MSSIAAIIRFHLSLLSITLALFELRSFLEQQKSNFPASYKRQELAYIRHKLQCSVREPLVYVHDVKYVHGKYFQLTNKCCYFIGDFVKHFISYEIRLREPTPVIIKQSKQTIVAFKLNGIFTSF